jgi:adenylosuccinate lyase
VERVVLPDSSIAVDYVLHLAIGLMDGLRVFPDRMRANVDSSYGLFFSQRVLTALIERGLDRDEAYRAVQRAAADSWDHGLHFRERMWQEIEGTGVISRDEFWELFVLRPFVEGLDPVFARLQKLEVASARPSEPETTPVAPWLEREEGKGSAS